MAPPYGPIDWRLVLCDHTGRYISMLDGIASDISLRFMINRPASLSFSVPSEDPRVNIIHSDTYPYLSAGTRYVKAYRKVFGLAPGGWDLKFVGRVWTMEDHGDGDTVRTSVTCFDPLKILEKRICRNHGGGYLKQVKFWDPALANQSPGDGHDGSSGAHVIKKLIERTHLYAGAIDLGDGTLDETASADQRKTGLDITGVWENTSPVTFTADQAYILPSIITQILDTQTCDLTVEYKEGFSSGTFLKLGAKPRVGIDQFDDIIFVYAAAPYTAREYTRTKSMESTANLIHLFGKKKSGWAAYNFDEDSYDLYSVLEDVESVPGVEHQQILQYLANMRLNFQKDPRDLVSIIPTPEGSATPWIDYNIGDGIQVNAGSSPFPVTRETVSGVQRVYGFTIQVDDDIGEVVSEIIVSSQDAVG